MDLTPVCQQEGGQRGDDHYDSRQQYSLFYVKECFLFLYHNSESEPAQKLQYIVGKNSDDAKRDKSYRHRDQK